MFPDFPSMRCWQRTKGHLLFGVLILAGVSPYSSAQMPFVSFFLLTGNSLAYTSSMAI